MQCGCHVSKICGPSDDQYELCCVPAEGGGIAVRGKRHATEGDNFPALVITGSTFKANTVYVDTVAHSKAATATADDPAVHLVARTLHQTTGDDEGGRQ